MSVNIEIKPNEYNPKKTTIPEIAQLMGLKYGYSDNHYCLEENQVGTYTILYDPQKLAVALKYGMKMTLSACACRCLQPVMI
ncbi:MAG: hypothetical protein E7492_03135 [Ruminococcaceae bacterium]|nr:hypothetical protein [Oscillospiraceae bacterium]